MGSARTCCDSKLKSGKGRLPAAAWAVGYMRGFARSITSRAKKNMQALVQRHEPDTSLRFLNVFGKMTSLRARSSLLMGIMMMREPELGPTQPSLLLRFRDASDAESWRTFVSVYAPLIYRSCRRRGLQDADAADVGQEVLTQVARSIRDFAGREKGTSLNSASLVTIRKRGVTPVKSRTRERPRIVT